jgi:hypothetical protein
MYKHIQIILGVILAIGSTFPIYSQVTADSDSISNRRFEIGGQFNFLRRADADTVLEILHRSDPVPASSKVAILTELGLGGRFGVNFSKNIDIEVEANVFPADKQRDMRTGVPVTVLEPGGRKFQMLFGPRIGVRFRRFGVFGKVRPGFIRLDRYEVIEEISKTSTTLAILSGTRNGLAFLNVDIGGVVEYYPSTRTILRFDAGDTIIRYGAQEPKDINPSFTRHNLQLSVGFGFRF